jgi:hypothetical protein
MGLVRMGSLVACALIVLAAGTSSGRIVTRVREGPLPITRGDIVKVDVGLELEDFQNLARADVALNVRGGAVRGYGPGIASFDAAGTQNPWTNSSVVMTTLDTNILIANSMDPAGALITRNGGDYTCDACAGLGIPTEFAPLATAVEIQVHDPAIFALEVKASSFRDDLGVGFTPNYVGGDVPFVRTGRRSLAFGEDVIVQACDNMNRFCSLGRGDNGAGVYGIFAGGDETLHAFGFGTLPPSVLYDDIEPDVRSICQAVGIPGFNTHVIMHPLVAAQGQFNYRVSDGTTGALQSRETIDLGAQYSIGFFDPADYTSKGDPAVFVAAAVENQDTGEAQIVGFGADLQGSVLGTQWGPSFSPGTFVDYVSADCNPVQEATDFVDCMVAAQIFSPTEQLTLVQQVTIVKDPISLQTDFSFGSQETLPGTFNGAGVVSAKDQDFVRAYSSGGFGFLDMTLPDPTQVNVRHTEPDTFDIQGTYVYDPAVGQNYLFARATTQGTEVGLLDTGLAVHDRALTEAGPFSLSRSEDGTRGILFGSRAQGGGTELFFRTISAFADSDGDGIPDGGDPCPQLEPLGLAIPMSDDSGLSAGTVAGHTDSDGNGIGDECECGDQNTDGTVDVSDILAINAAIFAPELATALCDANDDQLCDVNDILAVNAKIFGADAYCERYPTPAR